MWIKCNDGLPDKGVKCLVVSSGNVLDYPYYLNESNRWVNIPFMSEGVLDMVSHWMLFPSPPTAEQVEGANLQIHNSAMDAICAIASQSRGCKWAIGSSGCSSIVECPHKRHQ